MDPDAIGLNLMSLRANLNISEHIEPISYSTLVCEVSDLNTSSLIDVNTLSLVTVKLKMSNIFLQINILTTLTSLATFEKNLKIVGFGW
jgi:hypothetical protein